jgi:hypothetical protein
VLVLAQPILGKPWPTIILEIGNTESVTKILDIRDRALGHKTAINIFIGVVYNENSARPLDTWFVTVAHRNLTATAPTPNSPNKYPPAIVIGEFTKANGRYPRVNDAIVGNTVWSVPTSYLYHPKPVPALPPPLPPTLEIDLEKFRLNILRNRR